VPLFVGRAPGHRLIAELAMAGPHDFNSPHLGPVPTILLADDEPAPRTEVARLLRGGLRCHVCVAREGRHALRVFQQHPSRIWLVLTDFIMPLMDGGELAERIRDLDPTVPIVLMSPPLAGEAAELLAGYSDFPFLLKPFTYLELYRAVVPLLNRRSQHPWRRPSASWRSRSGRDGVSP
jgi:two-component system, cell cycle sensor histidine kinase and response regulator CckA